MEAQDLENAAELISRLGIPPRDICLDWAWQLREIELATSAKFEPQPNQIWSDQIDTPDDSHPDCAQPLGRELSWQELLVDEEGRLHCAFESHVGKDLAASSPSSAKPSIERLLTQVLEWSREDFPSSQSELGGVPGWSPTSSAHALDRKPMLTACEDASVVGQADLGAAHRPRRDRKSATKPKNRSTLTAAARTRRLRLAVCGSIAVVLTAVAAVFMGDRWKASSELPKSAVASDTDIMAEVEASDAPWGELELAMVPGGQVITGEPDGADATAVSADAALQELATLKVESPEELEMLPASASAVGEGFGQVPADLNAESQSVEKRDDQLSPIQADGNPVDANLVDGAAAVDVVSEIAGMTAEAERISNEVEVASGSEDVRKPQLSLPVSPMLQIQKFPLGGPNRPKEPGWRLRVLPQAGFEVRPENVQTLARGQTVAWELRHDSQPLEALQILVQAQIVGSRGDRLRWRISASDSQLSQIVLPLDGNFLQRIRLSLLSFEARLEAALATWKQIGTSGMSPEAKASLAAAKRAGDYQLKLAEGMLDSVLRVEQLVRALDGEFEIAAELVDLKLADSPALLQFGTLQPEESPDSHAAEDTPPLEDGDGSADD